VDPADAQPSRVRLVLEVVVVVEVVERLRAPAAELAAVLVYLENQQVDRVEQPVAAAMAVAMEQLEIMRGVRLVEFMVVVVVVDRTVPV
jgi:hypothetical protein